MAADMSQQIWVAETVGELLATSSSVPTGFELEVFRQNLRRYAWCAGRILRFRSDSQKHHIRRWIRHASIPRLDSLIEFSRSQKVSVVGLFTERINHGNNPDQKRVSQTQPRVAANIVEEALQTALQAGVPPSVLEISNELGYRCAASLQNRFPGLCGEIAGRRKAGLKVPRSRSPVVPVPRDRIEKALIEELSKPGFTDLRALAASVGLSSKRRLYKDFHDLRAAIVTKNAPFRKRRGNSSSESTVRVVVENAVQAAFREQPVPTVAEVARRLGFADVRPVTSRFPELTAELRSCRRATRMKRGHRVSEHFRQGLTAALTESPPPSCSEIARRVAGHKTQIREDFPDLWAALRARYKDYKGKVHQSKRQAFVEEVFRVVAELHQTGVYPSVQLVLATIPVPQFRSWAVVAEAVRLARRKLAIESYAVCRGHA